MILSKLVGIEIKEYFRSPAAAFWTFAYPFVILSLLMFAFGDSSVENGAKAKIGYGAYLICGMLTINTLSTSLFGFAIPLVEARQRGALKMFQIFPVWRFSYILSIVVSRVLVNILFNIAFILIGSAIFKIDLGINADVWFNFIPLLFICTAAFVAMGFLLVSVCNRASTATAIANVSFFPMLFFSNLFIPTSVFPSFLRAAAEYSPIGIAGAAFREVMLNHASLGSQGGPILVLIAVFLVSVAISTFTFSWRAQ